MLEIISSNLDSEDQQQRFMDGKGERDYDIVMQDVTEVGPGKGSEDEDVWMNDSWNGGVDMANENDGTRIKKTTETTRKVSDTTYFKLHGEEIKTCSPSFSTNLIKVYSLEHLGKTMDRFHPVTHEKINKLRKSYVGKVKSLGIAGKNQAVDTFDAMGRIVYTPKEDWDNTVGKQFEQLQRRLTSSELSELLKGAVGANCIRPGRVNEWKTLSTFLGIEDIKPRNDHESLTFNSVDRRAKKAITSRDEMVNSISSTTTTPQNSLLNSKFSGATTNDLSSTPTRSDLTGSRNYDTSSLSETGTRSSRPERLGKKRRYIDSSFEGYSDTFVAEELRDSPYTHSSSAPSITNSTNSSASTSASTSTTMTAMDLQKLFGRKKRILDRECEL